ncbi:hypothetical protein AVEN_121010-1 [Araneus ventricosus]|uniref:Uncharacterized protein n=1 Tax=Araneus ventricosus TaxID=182803 RepID=A0A4Y2MDA7_ARAVE|nr:hypothetical protein AVEN_121010-1 [Araneus ventricosus]
MKMSILAGSRKCCLKILAEELGEKVNDSHKLKDLKKIILASKECDEECAKEWLNTIIERKEKEEIQEHRRQEEIVGRKLQEEIQIEERKQQEEIAERKRQEENQERWHKKEIEEHRRKEEYEERKRKDEMEYELQKIRIGAEGRFSNSVANQNVNSTQIKPKLELYHLMQKFNSDESDISLYLIMFERLTKQAEIFENT